MFTDKEYKEKQKEYCTMLSITPDFDKYIIKYLEWKRTELYKGFRGITPTTPDSEAKATATKYDGAISVIDDILRRFKV